MKKKDMKIFPEQAERLEEGFRLGMSREETLAFAGVEVGVFEAVCKADTLFAAKLEQQKGYGAMMARRAILKAIESGNESLSKWYLDRLDEEAERDEKRKADKDEKAEFGGQVIKVEFAIPRPEQGGHGPRPVHDED